VFSHIFETFGSKNNVNTENFCALEAQKHGIYDIFLPLVAKITVFTFFVGQRLAKTLVFAQFSPFCKM